jgi:hypothetical protein
MANSGIILPTEISNLVSERTTLWQKFDEAQSQFNEIEKLASQIASSTPAQIPSELTNDRTPPAEVVAALQNLQMELMRISKGQDTIKGYQAEIKKLESQQLTIVIAVGLLIAIVLSIIALGGILIAVVLLSNISR